MAPNIELVLEQPHLLGLDAPTGKIDPIDATTPDAHVSRDPRLIRLTGKHPLNAEPPVKSLIESGFITSNSLHVVRNHGPVPLNDSNTHVISIGGLVNHPVMITMSQLLELPSVTLPVTICCAGNRRKEQNMIKPSIGFSWGPAGVGTAYWTGVYLRDVINTFAGGLKPEALHICMEGNDSTAKGPYGTSLTVQRAMSPEYDVMLAYKMNGEPLPYDHGYPVRSIVPGCIGGRSVKWLSKIEATTYISRNPFQDADNKVFPPTVLSADQATTENWWSNPDYSVYDLNINSVIAAPFHGTQVLLDDLNKLITLKGYAYGGSNRKVTRCEITIDDGKTWKLATIHTELKKKADAYAAVHFDKSMQRPNKSYSETRNWTWVHWSLELPITDLLGAKEICLRCWNDANNSQPKDMTWSLMGMLNNCWYRVRVHLVREPALALLFQHPTTLPGDKTLEGISLSGWMEEENASKLSTEKKKSQGSDDNLKLFSEEEVAKHDTEDDCWLIYNEKVYNCTSFLTKHPGGASSIILAAGTDCTDEFDAIHSQKAKDMFEDYLIGKIKTKATIETKAQPQEEPIEEVVSKEEAHTAAYFEPKTWKKLVLQNKECLSPTLFRFTFSIPEEHYDNSHLSLPVGMHVFLKLKEDINDCSPKPKMVIRAYTPSKVSKKTIEFVIKVYFPYNNVPGGRLTTALNCIRVGESIDFKGPVGEIEYHGNGELSIHQKRRNVKQIGMIAGGTGITPMWQIIQALEHDQERPLVSLIYCARSINEIIFHKELDILQSRYGSDKFKVR
ncbi:Nitrate reductase [NADH] 1 [Choanephora cucurbitarum]|uniref:Nitrate reductase [NADPH] n=1 Tax=Choanephora cucurbitarum TaxID=101091 RepID=A0A1C7NAU0_9FUNG|nr:Nitrate reductase [NADH] 1 [Choanephora cucurbitarum]